MPDGNAVLSTAREPVILVLPLPPSANRMYRVVGGKQIKSQAYREWIQRAGWEAKVQLISVPMITGDFKSVLEVPRTYDLDNNLKPLYDLCQSVGAIRNDKYHEEMHVYRMDRETVLIELTAL